MKVIKGKKVGRKKIRFYKKSIINDYRNLEDKVITIPKVISEDYGFEMQFGIEPTPNTKERGYLYKKHTPQYRK